MSLVLSTKVDDKPVLYGDILFSRTDKKKPSVIVPTIPDISLVMNNKSLGSIEGYVQKLICLRDDVAIGWVGSLLGARIACDELNRSLPKTGTNLNNLLGTIGCIVLEKEYHIKLVLWVGKENPQCFSWDSDACDEIVPASLPYVIGSGSRHIAAILNAPEIREGTDSIGSILTEAGGIISYELAYGLNLRDLWGGSIQIVYFNGATFVPFTDYMLFFFYIEEKQNKDFQATLHPYIFRPMQVKSFYIIQRFNWHKKIIDYFAAHHLLHMQERLKLSEIRPPITKPSYYCFAGIFHHKNGGDSPLSFAMPQKDALEYFDIDYSQGLSIAFSMKFFKMLGEIGKRLQRVAENYPWPYFT